MTGKTLTRSELVELVEFVSEALDAERYQAMSRIANHAHSAEFAPEAPTDDEINAAIARGMEWVEREATVTMTDNKNEWDNWPRRWAKPGKGYTPYHDWQPVSNLTQALEAAMRLGVYVKVTTHPTGHLRRLEWSATRDSRFQGCSDAASDAARAIALHLYENLQARKGGTE